MAASNILKPPPISSPISTPAITFRNPTPDEMMMNMYKIQQKSGNEIMEKGGYKSESNAIYEKMYEEKEGSKKHPYLSPYFTLELNNHLTQLQTLSAEDNPKFTLNPDPLHPFQYDYSSLNLDFDLPNYGVEEYIADRTRFVKGMTSLGNEPGWFYFKVMFKFNTNFGLLGGLLSDNHDSFYYASNAAIRYLWLLRHHYQPENIKHRMIALYKFGAILNKIVNEAPWCIKSVGGLADALNTYTKDFSKERSFELTFAAENMDMRISTLFDLYKYACFDDINCKEIIPENLRKFDMAIVFFHVPIKYLQTAIMVAPKKNISTGLFSGKLAQVEAIVEKAYNFLTTTPTYYQYKRMSNFNGDFSKMISFKMLTFQNCEFDPESFSKYLEGGEINNEKAFQLGNNTIKIKYDRVFYHNMNEWNEMFFGSDGFGYNVHGLPDKKIFSLDSKDNYGIIKKDKLANSWQERLKSLKEAKAGAYFYDENAEQYKALIDFSEAFITDGLMSMKMEDYYSFIKGNIYGPEAKINSKYFTGKITALTDGTIEGNLFGKKLTPNSNKEGYFEQKVKKIKNGSITGNIYDRIYGVMGTGENRKNTDYLNKKLEILTDKTDLGNLYGNIGPNSDYGLKKIKSLVNGILSGNIFDLNIGDFNQDAGVKSNPFDKPDIELAPKSEYNEKSDPNLSQNNIKSAINSAEDDPFKVIQERQRMKEIWNYQLSGSNNSSSVGGAMDAVGDIVSFWKW